MKFQPENVINAQKTVNIVLVMLKFAHVAIITLLLRKKMEPVQENAFHVQITVIIAMVILLFALSA